MKFRVGHRDMKLPHEGIYCCPGSTISSLAFVNLERVHEKRERLTRRNLKNRPNAPVAPGDASCLSPAEDPFITAVLFALAQHQLQHDPESTVFEVRSHPQARLQFTKTRQVRALALLANTKHFFLYTARIPPEFLLGFQYPSKSFPSQTFDISYRHVPLQLKNTLVKRIDYTLREIGGHWTRG